jgi:hypothetical protein
MSHLARMLDSIGKLKRQVKFRVPGSAMSRHCLGHDARQASEMGPTAWRMRAWRRERLAYPDQAGCGEGGGPGR